MYWCVSLTTEWERCSTFSWGSKMNQNMHNQIVLPDHRQASRVTVGQDASRRLTRRGSLKLLSALCKQDNTQSCSSHHQTRMSHTCNTHSCLQIEKAQMQHSLPVFITWYLCAILLHNKQESHCQAATSGPPRTIYTRYLPSYQANLPACMTREFFAVLTSDVQEGEEEGEEEEGEEEEEKKKMKKKRKKKRKKKKEKQNLPSKYFWVEHSTRKLSSSEHSSNTKETSNKYLTKVSLCSQVWCKDASSKVESSFLGHHLSE